MKQKGRYNILFPALFFYRMLYQMFTNGYLQSQCELISQVHHERKAKQIIHPFKIMEGCIFTAFLRTCKSLQYILNTISSIVRSLPLKKNDMAGSTLQLLKNHRNVNFPRLMKTKMIDCFHSSSQALQLKNCYSGFLHLNSQMFSPKAGQQSPTFHSSKEEHQDADTLESCRERISLVGRIS